MNLTELKDNWVDTEAFHQSIRDYFVDCVNKDEFLNEHRTFVENNVMGFGDRSFQWFWKLLVDEMPSEFSFIEVGVFKGQILSLIKALASATGRRVERYGVTPLDSSGGVWESDYRADIERMHDYFFIPKDYTLYVGSSTEPEIIEQASNTSPYDICYVDGAHDRLSVDSDLKHYAPMVKYGGWLVIDDAACNMKQPWGYFQGIQDVTDSLLAYMDKNGDQWEFFGNVMHLVFYRKK